MNKEGLKYNKETELTNLILKTQNNHETITLKITDFAPAADNASTPS